MAFRSVFSLAPGVAAAVVLGVSDVLVKIIVAARVDVLTMLSFRSVIGIVFMTAWLRFGPKPSIDARGRWISLGIGVLFTVLIYCLFKAIELNDVPTAILTYFAYPLLTGLAAAATGLERLSWQGVACALTAFGGLAIMIGAHPAGLALGGIGYALAAASCRTGVLIVTRAYLVGADARLTTWYSVIAQTVIFVALSSVTRTWHPPQTDAGWAALVGMKSRDHGRHRLHLCFDHARRSVSHRADHESRTADRDAWQRAGARRLDHAAAGAGQRHHAGGAGRLSIVEMTGEQPRWAVHAIESGH